MSVNQYLDDCTEQNWQVVKEENKISNTDKKNSIYKPQTDALTSGGKSVLEARVQSLKLAISILKSQLLEEKILWKKEVEFMANFIASSNPESDVNSETETEVKSIKSMASTPLTSTEPLLSPPFFKDYEEKLNRYQGALAQAQAEKRLNIRRQIAANTYRKRLYEVEKLCQEELNKVRETATYLEPLKQMASEWNKPKLGLPAEISKTAIHSVAEKMRTNHLEGVMECGGDFFPGKTRSKDLSKMKGSGSCPYEVPVKQIDASLVMDEDASSEIKGKIVLQIGSLPSEVPTICYSAKFE